MTYEAMSAMFQFGTFIVTKFLALAAILALVASKKKK